MSKIKKIIAMSIISMFLILYANTVWASTISSDINGIDDGRYPGVKNLIQNLQNKHPNWKFQVEYTDINFEDAIMFECQGHGRSPRNLSPANNSKYAGMWICPVCNTKTYDSENWYCASEHAIRYMMDPRNSINESDIFQFLDLSYTDNSTISEGESTDVNKTQNEVEIVPDIDYGRLIEKFPNATIYDVSGNQLTEGLVGTGCKINIDNKEYTIIKKGDVNGDGAVNVIDVVFLLNYIAGKKELSTECTLAGKVQGAGTPNVIDVVNILNSIAGKKNITITTGNVSTGGLADNVKNMAASLSYLDNDCITTIINNANQYKINPLYLVARLKQEQGSGTSPLATGAGFNGEYVGFYNLFNINATGNSRDNVIKNGLRYAQSKNWNSKSASITGGIQVIVDGYISKKQNTLYYQKFNVVGTSGLYTHQYMQNILAAQNEGTTLRKTYSGIDPNYSCDYVFTIPVYNNMPTSACSRPDTNTGWNVNIEEKTVDVNSSLKVRSTASVSATVINSLSKGDKVKVVSTTPNAIDGHYWSLIVCEATGAYGYVAADYIK